MKQVRAIVCLLTAFYLFMKTSFTIIFGTPYVMGSIDGLAIGILFISGVSFYYIDAGKTEKAKAKMDIMILIMLVLCFVFGVIATIMQWVK